jgi:DNA-binding XRE family transcriptional regulator
MTQITKLHKRWLKTPGYKEAFDESRVEFELARHLIQARIKSGLSQVELATKMGTSQSTIARLESGSSMPSMRTLKKYAEATNSQLQIMFKPLATGKAHAA